MSCKLQIVCLNIWLSVGESSDWCMFQAYSTEKNDLDERLQGPPISTGMIIRIDSIMKLITASLKPGN